jgi:hypothetical protein
VKLSPISVAAWSFYSLRLDSYIKTQSLTGGPEVVGTLYRD